MNEYECIENSGRYSIVDIIGTRTDEVKIFKTVESASHKFKPEFQEGITWVICF